MDPVEGNGAPDPGKPPRVRGRRVRRRSLRRWASAFLTLTLLVASAAVFFLLQTARGQEAAIDFVIEQVRAALAGDLRVGEVRSRTLLTGATLTDVVLTDGTGRPVVSADSLVVRYLPTGILSASPRFRSVVFWGLDFEISRLSEDDALNLSRILAPRDPAPDSARLRLDLLFGQVGVRGGRLSVLSPAGAEGISSDEGLGGIVPGPLGPLRRLGLDGLDLDLEDAVLRIDEEVTFEADLASLAMRLSLPGATEPLVLRETFGRAFFSVKDGLRVTDGMFRLPETLGRGSIELGPTEAGAWAFRGDLSVRDWGQLADLRWADPRIPDGTFRGDLVVVAGGRIDVDMRSVEVRLPESNVTFTGGVSFDPAMITRDLLVTASPLAISRLEPWLEAELPLEGWLSGRATFSGAFDALEAVGRMTLVPVGYGGAPTTADFQGRIHLGTDLGWSGFEARLSPFNYEVLQAFAPAFPLTGQGAANVELDGRLARGVRVIADFEHETREVPASRVFVRGTMARPLDGWTFDLSGDVAPFALGAFAAAAPDFGLRGEARGPFTVRGPLGALEVSGSFEGGGGLVRFDGLLDALDPGARYRLDAEVEGLRVEAFSARVPDGTEWHGRVLLDGAGLTLDELSGRAHVTARGARVGAITVDAVEIALRAVDGVLYADTLRGTVAGMSFEGSGNLGLREGVVGEAVIEFEAASLVGLRPFFMGDSILVRDELSVMDREMLRLDGIDPDTLPTGEQVRMTGALAGTAALGGRVTDLSVAVRATLKAGAYGSHQVDSLGLVLDLEGLPASTGRWAGEADAFGLVWNGRAFERVQLAGQMRDRVGDGAVTLVRSAGEVYRLRGDFAVDSAGGEAVVREAEATLDGRVWSLIEPSSISWSEDALAVERLEIRRGGEDPMYLTAAGTLARDGDSDFRLDVEGLHLERLEAMALTDPLGLAGHLDLTLHVRGPAGSPLIDAELEILEPRFRTMSLSRAAGTLRYRDRTTELALEAWAGTRRALNASGTIPYDLSLAEVERRALPLPMDVMVTADSLDAALALAYFTILEDVAGMVSADLHISGTTADPTPTGVARLQNAAWSVESLGVRHRDVDGTLELRSDQTMLVDLSTRGTGVSTVTGTIGLSPISDPTLDLRVAFDRFRAMQRRDIEGVVSGQFTLRGTYQRPLAEGTLTVDEGVLQVDEFSRAAGVVDLTDPRLFGPGLAVDTTVFMSQPIFAEVRNPFLDNLRMNVALSVPRNTWLRSTDMNVEMGGELLVRYDRSASDLVLIGELQALRGTYLVLGRTFEVDEGAVSFIGRPGVNPALNITASSRVRRREGDAISILATVEGTLVQPTVTLTSEEGELSQSDLISYLVFNRSAAEIGRNQQSFLTGQVNSGALSTAVSGGVTFFTGAFFNQSGAALAQNLGLDYLSFSEGPASFEGLALNNTQLEAGRYLSDDVFVVVILRPLAGQGVNRWGGARLEWALTNSYNLEAFIEDRFLRSGTGFFGIRDLADEEIYGVLLFREWGYN